MLIISNGRHSEPSLPPTPLCGGGGGEAGVRSKGQGPHTGRPLQRSLSAALASAKKGKCFPRTNDGAAGLLRQAGPRSVLRFAKCRRTVYARFHCGKPSKAGEGGALGIDFSCPLWYNNKYSERKGTSRVRCLRLSAVEHPLLTEGCKLPSPLRAPRADQNWETRRRRRCVRKYIRFAPQSAWKVF